MRHFIRCLCLCLGTLIATTPAMATTNFDTPGHNFSLSGNVDVWLSHRDQDPRSLPRKTMGNEVLYQIFIDRFSNGNTANDCYYSESFCDRNHVDYYRYWGGDIRGVINQMGYLKELGVTRIWLTPIFENQMVTVERNRYGRDVEITSYHGYWFKDLFRLNPILTDRGRDDEAIVAELISAGAPQIKFLLDSVANHTSPSDPSAWSLDFMNSREPLNQSDGIERSHRGALFERGQYVTSMDEDEQRARALLSSYQRFFHPYGDITNYNDLFQVENFQLDYLSDLDQNNLRVVDYLRRAHTYWLTRFPGLAGYRMDTIKHVPQSYWRLFDRDLMTSFPNAEVVGEYFGAGPQSGGREYFRETHATMFDFDFRNTVQAVFVNNAPMSRFQDLWSADPSLKDARGLVTFVDNHDLPRLRGLGMSHAAMRQAVALMFASRGIPSIYYGLEQDLFVAQDPGDPFNRPMMMRFDRRQDLYVEIKKLAALRRENLALRYGSTHIVHLSDKIIGFERVSGDNKVLFATSRNPIAGRDSFDLVNLQLPDGSYTDVLSGQVYECRQGKVRVNLANGDIVMLSTTRRAQAGQ